MGGNEQGALPAIRMNKEHFKLYRFEFPLSQCSNIAASQLKTFRQPVYGGSPVFPQYLIPGKTKDGLKSITDIEYFAGEHFMTINDKLITDILNQTLIFPSRLPQCALGLLASGQILDNRPDQFFSRRITDHH